MSPPLLGRVATESEFTMTSHELIRFIPRSLAEEIFEFCRTNDKKLYRAAIEAVAQARKLRPVFLERQSRNERYDVMLATLARPNMEMAADSLIRNWLLKKHKAVLVDFMDALQIQHDGGVVGELPKSVDDLMLRNAVEGLLSRHPVEVVALYLNAFNGMNGERWTNLEALLNADARLQLTPSKTS